MADRRRQSSAFDALKVALVVAVVCALVVSSAAVILRPRYVANLEAERTARLAAIVEAVAQTLDGVTIDTLEARVVELASGKYTDSVDPATFDADKALGDPNRSVAIPPSLDVAGIQRRARHAIVFVVRKPDGIAALILPVWGSGYQSTLRGFLALDREASTVLALKFYEQGDTPGLGARIQDPAWEALWPGKHAFDRDGELRIGVRGPGASSGAGAAYLVDGISGATRTSLGVGALLQFWLGDFGFGPFLERVRAGEA